MYRPWLKRTLIGAVTCLGAFTASAVLADTGPLIGAAGGTVTSYVEPQVRMASEHVSMVIFGERGASSTVEVEYVLQNMTDRPVSMLTGFPERSYDYGIKDGGSENLLQGFRAFVDGQQVQTELRQDPARVYGASGIAYTQSWHVYRLTFAPHQTMRVRNSYAQYPYGKEGSSGHRGTFEYILDTGAAWAGTIDEARIDVELKDASLFDVAHVSPAQMPGHGDWVVDPGLKKLSLFLTDIEPTAAENIQVTFSDEVYGRGGCHERASDLAGFDNQDAATAVSTKVLDRNARFQPGDETTSEEAPYLTGTAYFPCQAIDGDRRTAWISGDPKGVKGPPSLTLRSLPSRQYRSISFLSGFSYDNPAKDPGQEGYRSFSRAKKARFSLYAPDDPKRPFWTATLDIPDDPKGSILPIQDAFVSTDGRSGWSLRIDVLEVYPGEKYPNVAIAEVGMNGVPQGLTDISDASLETGLSPLSDAGPIMPAEQGVHVSQGTLPVDWKWVSELEFVALLLIGCGWLIHRLQR